MAWVKHFNLCWPCSFKREREGEFALTEKTCIPNPTCINLTTTVAIVKFLFMILRMEIKCFFNYDENNACDFLSTTFDGNVF